MPFSFEERKRLSVRIKQDDQLTFVDKDCAYRDAEQNIPSVHKVGLVAHPLWTPTICSSLRERSSLPPLRLIPLQGRGVVKPRVQILLASKPLSQKRHRLDIRVRPVHIFLMQDLTRAVGRPREFDLDEAIRSAMNVFWDRGYHDAALPDLLSAMEISKGSFYKAFGDKKAIFLRALELYSDDAAQSISKVLASDPSPKMAIRNAFLRFADLSSGAKGRRGCFAVLTATEMLPGDTQSADLVRRHYRRLQHLFTKAVREAQAAGEIDDKVDPESISHFIIAHAQGMRVLGKLGSTRKQTLEGVDLIMRMLF